MNAPDPRPPRGCPAAADARHAYDEADLARALNVYKFFYPTVSGAAIIKGNEAVGLVANRVFGIMDSNPAQIGFTLNSDTPYGPALLDLSIGPLVTELPPGPLIVCSIDVNQRWVAEWGCRGPMPARAESICWCRPRSRAHCLRPANTSTGPAATGRSSASARCRCRAMCPRPKSASTP